jgi:hypothetical protein
VLFDQRADMVDFFVPARCADHNILSRFDAGFDVRDHTVRCSEVDHTINGAEPFGRERGAVRVVFRPHDTDVMFPLSGDFGDERPGLAPA